MESIIRWLRDNKEWVFSGIGVLGITTIFSLLMILRSCGEHAG